jgi:hypothetical protein
MRPVSQDGSLWAAGMAYVAGEPIEQRDGLLAIIRDVLAVLRPESAEAHTVTVDGKVGDPVAFDLAALAALMERPDAGAVFIDGRGAETGAFHLGLYLRHNPGIRVERQPPGVCRLIAQSGEGSAEIQVVTDAALALVTSCAASLPVLHGGVTLLPSFDRALTEVSLVGIDLSRQPREIAERASFDSREKRRLWKQARRVYWITLLGPDLARKAGGPEAARAAGAADVREIGGSLIIRATESVTDVLDPEFSLRIRGLTRWLWPHIIQNPADAA